MWPLVTLRKSFAQSQQKVSGARGRLARMKGRTKGRAEGRAEGRTKGRAGTARHSCHCQPLRALLFGSLALTSLNAPHLQRHHVISNFSYVPTSKPRPQKKSRYLCQKVSHKGRRWHFCRYSVLPATSFSLFIPFYYQFQRINLLIGIFILSHEIYVPFSGMWVHMLLGQNFHDKKSLKFFFGKFGLMMH